MPVAEEFCLKCHVTACTNSAHPCGWNRITGGMYCLTCAARIDQSRDNPPVIRSFYPLVTPENLRAVSERGGGSWGDIVRVRQPA